MKKSTKIILPALAVLVLGTAATATGTVAWFASNGVVEATNMNVKCTTAKNLLISNAAPEDMTDGDAAYGVSVASRHTTVLEISPCSTTETLMATGTPTFYKTDSRIDAVSGNVVAKDTTKNTAGTTISAAVESTDYVKHSFWLMAQSVSDLNLSIKSVTLSATLNSNISQALRMGVYYKELTTAATVHSDIFNLGASGDTSYAGFNGTGELTTVTLDGTKVSECKVGDTVVTEEVTPSAYSAIANYSLGKVAATTTAAEISASTWTEIDFYFWYEGQDSHCTANDALNIQALDISIQLQAVAAAA